MTGGSQSRRIVADVDEDDGDSHVGGPWDGEPDASAIQNGQSYADAVQTAKHHLSVCLKLLGIMYRNDEDGSSPAPDRSSSEAPSSRQDDSNSVWPSESRGDSLYLAMVMLNSALLKALHVADSFQLHCHREFPKMASQNQDSPTLCDAAVIDGRRPRGNSDDRRITSEEYRRLQAQCLVHCETVWSLEQQRDSEKVRARQLEEDCRQIRAAIKKQQDPQSPKEPSPRPEPPEVVELRNMGVASEWQPGGGVVIDDTELQRLHLIMQNLNRIVQEARADAADSLQKSDEATRRAEKAESEREELQQLLGVDQDGLQSAARQLVQELSQACEQEQLLDQEPASGTDDAWERIRELQAQDHALEQQCHDLSIENSKLAVSAMSASHVTGRTMQRPRLVPVDGSRKKAMSHMVGPRVLPGRSRHSAMVTGTRTHPMSSSSHD